MSKNKIILCLVLLIVILLVILGMRIKNDKSRNQFDISSFSNNNEKISTN